MNNNDPIDRALVLEFLDEFCDGYPVRLIEEAGEDMQAEFTASEIAEIVVANARALRCAISLFPTVPQPMSAVEYEIAKERWSKWCRSQFSGRGGNTCEDVRCEYLGKCCVCQSSPEKRVAFIEAWMNEHPEEAEEE